MLMEEIRLPDDILHIYIIFIYSIYIDMYVSIFICKYNHVYIYIHMSPIVETSDMFTSISLPGFLL